MSDDRKFELAKDVVRIPKFKHKDKVIVRDANNPYNNMVFDVMAYTFTYFKNVFYFCMNSDNVMYKNLIWFAEDQLEKFEIVQPEQYPASVVARLFPYNKEIIAFWVNEDGSQESIPELKKVSQLADDEWKDVIVLSCDTKVVGLMVYLCA